jgi:hypothetical protein
MPCGTDLKFPIQPGSNLPIMLTRQALHRSSSSSVRSSHKPPLNTMPNILSFICSTTYDNFVHGTIFHLQHAGAMAAVINDDAVLKQANSNLSLEQKELLLWHYRLGHICIARVQSLLQKPRTNSFNDRQIRLISPSNNKSSHCHPPLCSSCQYARQKRKNPPKSSVSKPLTTTGLSDNVLNAAPLLMVAYPILLVKRRVNFNSPEVRSLWIMILVLFIILVNFQPLQQRLYYPNMSLKTTVTSCACKFRNILLIISRFMVEIGLMTASINVSLTSFQTLVLIIEIMQKGTSNLSLIWLEPC